MAIQYWDPERFRAGDLSGSVRFVLFPRVLQDSASKALVTRTFAWPVDALGWKRRRSADQHFCRFCSCCGAFSRGSIDLARIPGVHWQKEPHHAWGRTTNHLAASSRATSLAHLKDFCRQNEFFTAYSEKFTRQHVVCIHAFFMLSIHSVLLGLWRFWILKQPNAGQSCIACCWRQAWCIDAHVVLPLSPVQRYQKTWFSILFSFIRFICFIAASCFCLLLWFLLPFVDSGLNWRHIGSSSSSSSSSSSLSSNVSTAEIQEVYCTVPLQVLEVNEAPQDEVPKDDGASPSSPLLEP